MNTVITQIEKLAEAFLTLVTHATNKKRTKSRSRGDAVFQSSHPKVKDNKDHFPINDINQARNALARASQYNSVPEWYDGSLSSLVLSVRRAVHNKYPSINITDKSKHPKKG